MDSTSPTALVIDDSPVVRRYLRFRLESSGWNVAEAADAFSGLNAALELRPDLITLDLIMPINNGIDGIHLAHKIREESPDTTLLIVSGHASEQDVKSFLKKHDLEFFGKADPAEVGGFARLFARTDELLGELNRLEQLAGEAPIRH
jgi:two-component system, chemotaxis family, chemotaxis protein CheY